MNKSKAVMLSVMFLNVLYIVYSEGIKPVFKTLFNLIKVIFNEIMKPVGMYIYTLISNIFTYDYSGIMNDVKENYSNFIKYFKAHSFEDIYNNLIEIKNVVIIIIKQLYKEYKEGAYIINIKYVDLANVIYTRGYNGLIETCTFDIQKAEIVETNRNL